MVKRLGFAHGPPHPLATRRGGLRDSLLSNSKSLERYCVAQCAALATACDREWTWSFSYMRRM
jgi:hypothetical protein